MNDEAVLKLARECVASSMHDRDKSWGDIVRAGERDDCPEMRMVVKAIAATTERAVDFILWNAGVRLVAEPLAQDLRAHAHLRGEG